MSIENYIPIDQLCMHYQVEITFFTNLVEIGIVEIHNVDQTQYIHSDKIGDIEKMIRLHQELDVNIEGIDIIFNMLQKIDKLEAELLAVKNRLRIHESH